VVSETLETKFITTRLIAREDFTFPTDTDLLQNKTYQPFYIKMRTLKFQTETQSKPYTESPSRELSRPKCERQGRGSFKNNPGSIPWRDKRYFSWPQCPHQLWGPPRTISNRYRDPLPGMKRPKRGDRTTHHSDVCPT
jgi:hypothetical protein